MSLFSSDPGEKSFVKKHWLPLAALAIMVIVVAVGSSGAEASKPGYMHGSGIASLITFLNQSPLQTAGLAATDILADAFFWLVLPVLVVFVVIAYALHSAFHRERSFGIKRKSRGKIIIPLSLILALLVYAWGEYAAFAALINSFGMAGIAGLSIIVVLIIVKRIKDLVSEIRGRV